VRILARASSVLVASPAFVAARGAPQTPADIPGFPTISLNDRPGPDHWTLTNSAGETVAIAHEPRLSATTFPIIRQAVMSGFGIGLLPEYALTEHMEAERLVRILPDWSLPQGTLHLVFTSRRGLLPSVRAVIEFVAEAVNPRTAAWDAVI
jgi:DNA-binding transcriptional LysR family regulator